MEILASFGQTISIAALWTGVVICIFVFYRGMRSKQGYAAVAPAGFAAGFAPSALDSVQRPSVVAPAVRPPAAPANGTHSGRGLSTKMAMGGDGW